MRFRLTHEETDDGISKRESYVIANRAGAVEGWRSPSAQGFYGGIEVHYTAEALYTTKISRCRIVGGTCWTTGSSLAFRDIEDLFDDGKAIRRVLCQWARGRIATWDELKEAGLC